jgi:hypothetical protein
MSGTSVGSRGGGGGGADFFTTYLLCRFCVEPCIYGYCVGCWLNKQSVVYGVRNRWYREPRPTTTVVGPDGTVIVTAALSDALTPPLETLTINRD